MTRFFVRLRKLLWLVALSASAATQTLECGELPNKVDPIVTVSVRQLSQKLYEYSYTVANGATAQQEISDFDLDIPLPVIEPQRPAGWSFGAYRRRSTFGWGATEAAPLPPDTPDDGGVPPGIAQIKPGTSLGGFGFKSSKPPGPVVYYVTGYVPMRVYPTEMEAEIASEECPQTDRFKVAVRGMTQGPVDATPVQILIKPAAPLPVSIEPGAKGVIPVAILGGATFDVTRIDRASLQFGPNQTQAVDKAGHLEDVNGDGRDDLLVHFNSPSAGIQCGDMAAFLRGRTVDGPQFVGGQEIRTVSCHRR